MKFKYCLHLNTSSTVAIILYLKKNPIILFDAFLSVMEMVGPRYRTILGIVYAILFSIGFMLVAVFGYAVRDMFKLQLVMAGPNFLLLTFTWYVWLYL